ncbi:MAG: cupredoxin domain-containing protein [Luteitalea sp.]
MRRLVRPCLICLVSTVGAAGCGGGSSPTSPSTPTTPVPTGPTITIESGAATPKQLVVTPGTRVLFVNRDTRTHQMNSDPHPAHTECPELNQVGFLRPGDTRETGNLNTVRTCGFHDHDDPNNAALRGSLVIRP